MRLLKRKTQKTTETKSIVRPVAIEVSSPEDVIAIENKANLLYLTTHVDPVIRRALAENPHADEEVLVGLVETEMEANPEGSQETDFLFGALLKHPNAGELLYMAITLGPSKSMAGIANLKLSGERRVR